MNKKINNILIFILLILSFFLVGAYIIEFGLGHEPCTLCIYQRFPYFVSIILILSIFFTRKNQKTILMILALVFVSSAALAFYHVGIEQGFISESVCEVKKINVENTDIKQLQKDLSDSPIGCKNVTFRIFGLSLATINTIFSIFLSVIFIKLFLNYGKN